MLLLTLQVQGNVKHTILILLSKLKQKPCAISMTDIEIHYKVLESLLAEQEGVEERLETAFFWGEGGCLFVCLFLCFVDGGTA